MQRRWFTLTRVPFELELISCKFKFKLSSRNYLLSQIQILYIILSLKMLLVIKMIIINKLRSRRNLRHADSPLSFQATQTLEHLDYVSIILVPLFLSFYFVAVKNNNSKKAKKTPWDPITLCHEAIDWMHHHHEVFLTHIQEQPIQQPLLQPKLHL